VETDNLRYTFAQTIPTGVQRIFAAANPDIDIDGNDDARVDADVAVIDTGIDLQHPDLQVMNGVNCTGTLFNTKCVAAAMTTLPRDPCGRHHRALDNGIQSEQ